MRITRPNPEATAPEKTAQNSNRASIPSISLPKGGGAIRGIGEKFAANPVTGTGWMTLPIPTSAGRSGFGPRLSLSYDSGAGNGPFGFGWSLSVPSISRKTDKGLPKYQDTDNAEESDVFILSGSEDLVPVLAKANDGTWTFEKLPERTLGGKTYRVRRYRSRTEGLFTRIERWTEVGTERRNTFWRTISKDNIISWYGRNPESRIIDPTHAARIFSWLICESYDDKGNAILYDYAKDTDLNFEAVQCNERHRVRTANRYLKQVRYGNRTPNRNVTTWEPIDAAQLSPQTWMFDVVFDYGEGHYSEEPPDTDQRAFARAEIALPADSRVPLRKDRFSTYRGGFEIRTYRLCRRVLMFHHFPEELGINDCLVHSTDFSYSESPVASFITAVTQSGYVRRPLPNQAGRYLKKSFPPVEFEYSRISSPEQLARQPIRDLDSESMANLPAGLDGARYQWTDLDGEGTSGILTEQANGWFYKRNLSANNLLRENTHVLTIARLGPAELVRARPVAALADGAQFLDLAGDGQQDLVQMEGATRGFYERTSDGQWSAFRAFDSCPEANTRDPNLKLADLTGDGHADILITEGDALTWYPSLGEEGFGPPVRVAIPDDEEHDSRLVFAGGEHSIFLADMAGDGLNDIVRIRNGEVCYWPNLGYGRFGARVTMDNSPWFDSPDQFDPQRIRLADTDGSGTTDILYVGRDGIRIYFNQSGNSWTDVVELPQFPPMDNISSVQALDLLGNGTACLVWSSPLAGAVRSPIRYVALMDEKPHLLVGVKNNLGAETRVRYAPSTKFFLDDKRAGKPWITRLPFPVHVVERVETHDHLSRNLFISRYAYHHGYFDGIEREFRGFGMVEQWDTEQLAALTTDGVLEPATSNDAAFHVPPVHTKTWFHTGVYVGRNHVSDFFAGLIDADGRGEYYREPGLTDAEFRTRLLPDTRLPAGLTVEEEREACRILKGMMLRQEVYADDAPAGSSEAVIRRAATPYTIVEQNFGIRMLQPRAGNRHGVFLTHRGEVLTYHYERDLDPRIQHALTLEVDEFGNVLKSAEVGYGRRTTSPGLNELDPPDREKQTKTLIMYTENRVSNAIVNVTTHPNDHRTPLPVETRTYELTGYTPTVAATRFQASDFVQPFPTDPDSSQRIHIFETEIPYEDQPTAGRQRRLIEHARTLYRKDDLTGLLPLGQLDPLALTGEGYKLALTPGLITQVFRRNGQPLLPNQASVLGSREDDGGGYASSDVLKTGNVFPPNSTHPLWTSSDADGHWWIPSGRVSLSPDASHAPIQELDHARQHFFMPRRYRDPFHTNTGSTETIVTYDKHDLLMVETRDPLLNVVTVATQDNQGTVVVRNDYRILQPYWITDPNRNRTQLVFDALGMVVATAVMGKSGQNAGDNLNDGSPDLTQIEIDNLHGAASPSTMASNLLKSATTRIVYDLHRFRLSQKAHPSDPTRWMPASEATLKRETHVSDPLPPQGLKVQIAFTYSDGFGREIQRKIQAEPGQVPQRDASGRIIGGPDGLPVMTANDVTPRWVGSGWIVYNNKGKPVRKYEPFFTDTHRFEFDVRLGVSPVLFYDPVQRAIATLHPNNTHEKIVFTPWRQANHDVNDTVASDPRADEDLRGYVREYFKGVAPAPDAWKTWLQERNVNAAAPPPDTPSLEPEIRTAVRTLPHAGTPSLAFLDTLGRTFLTIAHNKFLRRNPDGTTVTMEQRYATRVELDIEGNKRLVRDAIVLNGDAQGRIVMRYDYNMLGGRIHQASMEAGVRWNLADAMGKPIRAWDSRMFMRRMTYDRLRRPVGLFVTEGGVERLAERTVYGEAQGDAKNHRTRVHQVFDGAGIVTSVAYDFKGNVLESRRDLLPDYKQSPNWLQNPAANDGTFTSLTSYDALNRPLTLTAPDNSVLRPTFNEANLLEKLDVQLRASAAVTPFVTDIDYNARGQRTLIAYANGARTTYEYDVKTFRLSHLKTVRAPAQNGLASQIFKNPGTVQDLHYSYDPAGNVTRIADESLPVVMQNNQEVAPVSHYTYDAVYRLIEAAGREHTAQGVFAALPPDVNFRDHPFARFSANPNDLQALRNYTEFYEYDVVGNFEKLVHQAANGSWTRTYAYNEANPPAPVIHRNRIVNTTIGQTTETYTHDPHGNVTSMAHLTAMQWDFKDQLHTTSTQVTNNAGAETTFYVYAASGQRVRKVTERQNGTRKSERIYVGEFELFREFSANGQNAERARETLHVMDDKQRVALVETRTVQNGAIVNAPTPISRYQYGNHLGSASLELDKDGALISYEEYHPYGTSSLQAMSSTAEVSLKRYRYTGKERDEETGLSYHGARYYASWLGRWTSCDPMGLTDGINLYRYTSNNPIRLTDPSGTQGVDQTKKTRDNAPSPPPEGAQPWSEALQKRVKDIGEARDRIVKDFEKINELRSMSPDEMNESVRQDLLHMYRGFLAKDMERWLDLMGKPLDGPGRKPTPLDGPPPHEKKKEEEEKHNSLNLAIEVERGIDKYKLKSELKFLEYKRVLEWKNNPLKVGPLTLFKEVEAALSGFVKIEESRTEKPEMKAGGGVTLSPKIISVDGNLKLPGRLGTLGGGLGAGPKGELTTTDKPEFSIVEGKGELKWKGESGGRFVPFVSAEAGAGYMLAPHPGGYFGVTFSAGVLF
jgi:RHS repeat-associated protein